MRVPVALYPSQHLILSFCKVCHGSCNFNWHFPNEVCHLLIFLFSIHSSSLVECLDVYSKLLPIEVVCFLNIGF